MIQENEVITLLIGIGMFIFILINYPKLRELPARKIIITALTLLLIGWILTILEGFFLNDFLNLIEHICYASSSIILIIWFWITFKKKRSNR